jgi:hypothetical protein
MEFSNSKTWGQPSDAAALMTWTAEKMLPHSPGGPGLKTLKKNTASGNLTYSNIDMKNGNV